MPEKKLTFEQAFKKLEEAVQKLEQGSLTLEEAIAVFEEGMSLVKTCNERLDAAELKITQLQCFSEQEPEELR